MATTDGSDTSSPCRTGGRPILIVGAGRSGTKLLRRLVSSHPEVEAFPREINYIWRHGNADHPDDELTPAHARPEVVGYIRKRFARFREWNGAERICEKTCANALRVDFVRCVFPRAIVVHLVRDGRAVAESARRRWTATPPLSYLLEKARWIPVTDLPFYVFRYLKFQLSRGPGGVKQQSSWGARFSGIDRAVSELPLLDVCALQWQACVRAVEDSFARMPDDLKVTVRYRDLVTSPAETTRRLFSNLGLDWQVETREYVEREVRPQHLDKWRERLSSAEVERLRELIGDDLDRLGLPSP